VRRTVLLSSLLAVAALGLVPAGAGAAQNPWLERRVLNIAHQGGESEFPSNTLYAFRRSVRAGADMLELDIGVTRDGKVVVMHDTTLNRTTNGRGTIASHTLKQLRKLDAAYWFAPGRSDPYRHGLKARAYRLRGVATGKRNAPRGFKRSDFRVATLREVMRAFPHTPINIEVKGRTKQEETPEYVRNAEALAKVLKGTHRRDLIVTSFRQQAVDRFHQLVPAIALAPGVDGAAAWLLGGGSPGEGVAAFELPITYVVGAQRVPVTTAENVARAHREGYAWQTWLSDDGESVATWRTLIDECVDGVMTAKPVAFERTLRKHPAPAACG
jgi:glycerophosphoryl diester phosphodiesterase